MSRAEAISLLMDFGWNKYGAEAIIDQVDDLRSLTAEALIALSDDYMDR